MSFIRNYIMKQVSDMLCFCVVDQDSVCDTSDVRNTEDGLAMSYYNEGVTAQKIGDIVQAIQYLEQALEEDSGLMIAHSSIAECYQLCKRSKDAEKHLQIILDLDPFNYKAVFSIGSLYLNDIQQPALAIGMFEKCLEMNPNDVDAQLSSAIAYTQLGKNKEAICLYETLLKDEPGHTTALFNLGVAYSEVGELDSAILMYKRVLSANPNNIDAYFNMASTYQKLVEGGSLPRETKLRYLSDTLGCYQTILNWKDSISKQFVDDAKRGIELVKFRRSQLKGDLKSPEKEENDDDIPGDTVVDLGDVSTFKAVTTVSTSIAHRIGHSSTTTGGDDFEYDNDDRSDVSARSHVI